MPAVEGERPMSDGVLPVGELCSKVLLRNTHAGALAGGSHEHCTCKAGWPSVSTSGGLGPVGKQSYPWDAQAFLPAAKTHSQVQSAVL
eukprot:5916304-Amphidinium_carterae.1